jgi:hypothetical protein
MAGNRSGALKQFRHLALERYKWVTYIVSAMVVLSVTIIVFRAEAQKNKDIMIRSEGIQRIIDDLSGQPKADPKVIAKYVDTTEELSSSGNLRENAKADDLVEASSQKVVTSIYTSLTWSDETTAPGFRLRRYQNQPDSFTVSILSPNGTILAQETGSSGSLGAQRDLDEEEVLTFFGNGNFTVRVSLDDAGDWEPRLGPGIPISDTGNDYSLVITVGYKVDPKTLS